MYYCYQMSYLPKHYPHSISSYSVLIFEIIDIL